MFLVSKIVNLGIISSDDIHATQLKRQVNGLNLFYFFVAMSAFFVFRIFIPNSIVLQIVQVFGTLLYFSYLVLNSFGKIKITRFLTIYTFEIQLFLIALFSNGFKSPVIYIFVLFPVLAGLVEESILKHMVIALTASVFLMMLHYFLPGMENIIMNISKFDNLRSEVLVIMAIVYIPIMATVIIQIIIKENQRARKMQKVMQLEETKYTENKKYLDNINEGLLLINKDYKISNQYSKYILSIISAEDISKKNFIDIIYPDIEKDKDKRIALEQYLGILFNNNTANASMLKNANPLKDKYIFFKGSENGSRENIVKINFQRIFNNGIVENIMALFEDVTNVLLKEKELVKEKFRKEIEMESITAILKQGPQTFLDFIEATNSVLAEVVKSIDKLAFTEVIDQVFRDLHSLKGFARVLELNTMADKLHSFENIFSMIRNKQKPLDNEIKGAILQFTNDLSDEKKNIKSLLDMILSFNRFVSNTGESKPKLLLDNFIISLKDMVKSVSNKLGKEIIFKTFAMADDFPYLNKLRNAIIHLIRNSIDHGIEDKFERMSIKKNQKGTIIFKLYKDNKDYYIEIVDDGGGLNFDIIKMKALEKNKITENNIPVTKRELIKLIFSPDFSSKNAVTDISGRGIGLNIVKKDVERLNGKIIVSTGKGKGTKFILRIPNNKIKPSLLPVRDVLVMNGVN